MKSIVHVSRVYDLPYESEPENGVYHHVDLRAQPDEINSLPELRGEANLRDLVATLNRPGGQFMTHGCAKALRPPYDSSGEIQVSEESHKAACWCTSYVTFSFWELLRNKSENYVPIYEQFRSDARGSEVCFLIQPAYFLTAFEWHQGRKYAESNGVVCLIWMSGWGETNAIATSRWRNVAKSLAAYFGDSAIFPDHHFTQTMTVSQYMLISTPFTRGVI